MEPKKLSLLYFSPTYSTRKVVSAIAEGMSLTVTNKHDITLGLDELVSFSANDLVVVGVPSYYGRVPELATKVLETKIKGDNTPCILACVYGNRDYDDTLLELKNTMEVRGFVVLSAGAFVAQHSIMPKVAEGRPNEEDHAFALDFGKQSLDKLRKLDSVKDLLPITVKGNTPYKNIGSIPFTPKGDKKCTNCLLCVRLCPTQAISIESPTKTDKKKCISCSRCIAVCPAHSRSYGGLLYRLASKKFTSDHSKPKQNETFGV